MPRLGRSATAPKASLVSRITVGCFPWRHGQRSGESPRGSKHIEKFPSSPFCKHGQTSSVLFTLFRSSTNAGQHRISPVTFVYAKSDRWQHPSHESQLSGLCALLRHSHVSAIPIRDHQLYYGLDSLQPRCNTELQAS